MEQNNHMIKAPAKMTIAKYRRVSTDNQELELQNDVLNRHIERLKEDNPETEYEVLDFKDFAVSGKTTERPEFKLMMAKVEKKQIQLIIFTKLDRLARSLQDLLNINSELEKNGVKITAIELQIDTSIYQGKLNFQIMGAFAEFERNITRERMEQGRKKAEFVGTKSGKPCHIPMVQIDEDGVRFKHKAGWSMHQIAKHYQVSITPIRRILNA
jgi:DNA invertase Pin-like site-specific DNA recombinase